MNCSFCHGTRREARQMSLGEFARVCANLRGLTEYLYFHLLGEPLTHPLLPIFIEHAARCGYKVAITTNGTLLDARAEELLLCKPYKINISLHSFEGSDAQSRREYIDSCIDFANRASEVGILVVLRLWNLSAKGIEDADIADLNGEVLASLRVRFGDFESVSERGARIKDKLHIELGKRFDWPDMSADELGQRVFCHGLGDHFGILSDGTVVPCCLDADGEMALGNIFESDVRGILKCKRAEAMREGFSQKLASEELCRRCGYARRFKI